MKFLGSNNKKNILEGNVKLEDLLVKTQEIDRVVRRRVKYKKVFNKIIIILFAIFIIIVIKAIKNIQSEVMSNGNANEEQEFDDIGEDITDLERFIEGQIDNNINPISIQYHEDIYYDIEYVHDFALKFEQDDLGRIIKVNLFDDSNEFISATKQEYDSNGNCINKYYLMSNSYGVYLLTSSNEEYKRYENDRCYYDNNERLARIDRVGDDMIKLYYEEGDNKPYCIEIGKDICCKYNYEYDDHQRIISQKKQYYKKDRLFKSITAIYVYE